jgi:hypothetical protein
MEKIRDLVRCTNCWEGFDWLQSRSGDRSGECPCCGRIGQVIHGGFLIFPRTQQDAWKTVLGDMLQRPKSNNGKEVKL